MSPKPPAKPTLRRCPLRPGCGSRRPRAWHDLHRCPSPPGSPGAGRRRIVAALFSPIACWLPRRPGSYVLRAPVSSEAARAQTPRAGRPGDGTPGGTRRGTGQGSGSVATAAGWPPPAAWPTRH